MDESKQGNSLHLLEQLRAWQKEQQQKLVEQQENQRKFLMEKQAKLFELLNSSSRASEMSEREDASVSRASVEDVPLRKPRQVKSFEEILQTSLRADAENKEPTPETQKDKKFKFLKRGEGIARFGVKPKTATRTYAKQKQGKENKQPKKLPLLKTEPQSIPVKHLPKENSEDETVSTRRDSDFESEDSLSKDLQLQPVLRTQANSEEPSASTHSRNEDELMVFELLERFATINSSFCSTSSLIGNLLEKGVTQLPSPSKVVTFLTQKSMMSVSSPRLERRVHFADSPQHSENFPSSLMTEVSNSPFVSNTIKALEYHEPEDFQDSMKENLERQSENAEPIEETLTTEHPDPRNTNMDLLNPDVIYQSSLLRSRLLSIEREISNYRRETANLRKSRKEHEDAKTKLEQEQEKFKRYAENEKRRMQLLYAEEQKRIKSGSKNEKTEEMESIDKLRGEIERLKEDFRSKESKWLAAQTKMQERIRNLEIKNRELGQQVIDLKNEEQNLRRRLNASLRPGASVQKPEPPRQLEKDTKEDNVSAVATTQAAKTAPANLETHDEKASKGIEENLSPRQFARVVEEPAKLTTASLNDTAAAETVAAPPKPTANPPRGGISQTELPDGTVVISYANGNRKEILANGKGCRVVYYNGDVKKTVADGTVIYSYSDTGTEQTTKPDGTEVLKFSNGQVETNYPDGRKEINHPDGARRLKYPDGREEAEWPDGTKLWNDGKGHGILTYPSGCREIYTPICKRREYPDGTVKTVYNNGKTETRYANGRIRIKGSDGTILTDTGVPGA